MMEAFLYVLGAFFLFVLLLPLMGIAIGATLYLGLPYSVGIALASVTHKIAHGSFFDLGAFWFIAIAWAVLLVHMRTIFKNALELDHAWHEGHYTAATTLLLGGMPFKRAKRALSLN